MQQRVVPDASSALQGCATLDSGLFVWLRLPYRPLAEELTSVHTICLLWNAVRLCRTAPGLFQRVSSSGLLSTVLHPLSAARSVATNEYPPACALYMFVHARQLLCATQDYAAPPTRPAKQKCVLPAAKPTPMVKTGLRAPYHLSVMHSEPRGSV
jgi:hypothetical protein